MNAPAIDHHLLAGEVRQLMGLTDTPVLRFLARGEYSINYQTEIPEASVVIRIVTGSQMGLSLEEQVRYESRALALLEPSGRTPRCLAVQESPASLPYPFLVESYLPGEPLDYNAGLEESARCIAGIHRLAVPEGHGLQIHRDPGPVILEESRAWAEGYLNWNEAPPASQTTLRRAFEVIDADHSKSADVFAEPDLVFVNYDLNTHNFIVRPADRFVSLVDWEKARVAPAVQDLAHFLLPTTTLWRSATATLLTPDQEARFLETYLSERPHLDRDRFMLQLSAMKRLIALRAVSWCSWAIWASSSGSRAISNAETLERSREYLSPSFLERLFFLE